MAEKEIDIIAMLKTVWQKRKKIFKISLIGAILGLVIAFSIPKTYQTTIKLAPEGSSKGSGSAGGLAMMMGVNIGGSTGAGITENIYPEIMSSKPFLLEFININVNYDNKNMPLSEYLSEYQKKAWWSHLLGLPFTIIKSFRSNNKIPNDTIDIFNLKPAQAGFISNLNSLIEVTSDKKTGVISISTEMQDPVISAVIADSLFIKLQRYMTNYKTEKTRADLINTQKMLEKAQREYFASEEAYAIALDRNHNLINKSAQVKLDRLSNDKSLAYSIYQQLATQVEMSKIKLQEQTPIATVIEPASIPLNAFSPNKILIIAAMTFLCALGTIFSIIISYSFPKENN